MFQQGLDLGAENQSSVQIRPVKRLLAHPVTGEKELLGLWVPQREREHSVQVIDAASAVTRVEMEDHLGVTRGLKGDSRPLQVGPEPRIVVDLSVEHEDLAPGSDHRLGTSAQVQDRQPAVPQADPPILADPHAFTVRTAMVQRLSHPLDQGWADAALPVPVLEDADYSAHG